MKKVKFLRKMVSVILIVLLAIISCNAYAVEQTNLKNEVNQRKLLNIVEPIEQEQECKIEDVPEINENSKQLLKGFKKDVIQKEEIKGTKKVYDTVLNRETFRVTTTDMEIDFDKDGNIVSYKNFEDFSTVDKNKRDYNENEINAYALEIEYEIIQETDLNDTIDFIETANELENYKIVDCSNEIEGSWVLTWCKDYGNNLINNYESVNVVVDAEDGSIMLFGKNEMVPNTIVPIITKEQAIEFAKSTILKLEVNESDIVARLSFFRPNYYWEGDGLYESSEEVRLTWEIDVGGCATVQIDAVTGENIGGGTIRETECARAMGVSANLNFANAFNATSSGRCFVGWNISIDNDTVVDFDRRFFPRLGRMTVYDAVVTSLWESRNAGFNEGSRLCNPGFEGDSNYYGWAW